VKSRKLLSLQIGLADPSGLNLVTGHGRAQIHQTNRRRLAVPFSLRTRQRQSTAAE
jgi:hypothetical protein